MLDIQSVQKSFDGVSVLQDVSLNIRQGDFFSIVGPSGCGKTTLLRIIAGLDSPDSGFVKWNGVDIAKISIHRRPFNMVFQRYALFPHMTVAENVGFGPTVKGWAEAEKKPAVQSALELVNMADFYSRRIDTLSGGQQQRVALARAIVNKPEVLLLDEPLSALDQKLREKMRIELLRIQRTLGITFILVTHDQEEALTMSDKIAIMNRGHLEQCGSPEEIYRRPKSAFVADFIGAINAFDIEGQRIYIRPEEIEISREPYASDENFQGLPAAVVREILFKGPVTDFVVDVHDSDQAIGPLIIQKTSSWHHGLEVGDKVFVRWPRESRFRVNSTVNSAVNSAGNSAHLSMNEV